MLHLAILEDVPNDVMLLWMFVAAAHVAIIPLVLGLAFRATRRVAGWLLIADLLGLAAIYVLGALFPSKAKMRAPMDCYHNLHQLQIATMMYASDHGERLPTEIDNLLVYVDDALIFQCPRPQKPGSLSNVSEWTPYVILPAATNADAVYLYCSRTQHNQRAGTYVVTREGGVAFRSPDAFTPADENGIPAEPIMKLPSCGHCPCRAPSRGGATPQVPEKRSCRAQRP